ncbi:MAG: winged helix-turn-helix domain-containing protein [Pseudohaliea sp.]
MSASNPYDHGGIDELIHGRIRLGVMAYLASASPATFRELRDRVEATDGNLATHLRKLETAGYIRQEKRFVGRRPQTQVHITDPGREAWLLWLERMQALIAAAERGGAP